MNTIEWLNTRKQRLDELSNLLSAQLSADMEDARNWNAELVYSSLLRRFFRRVQNSFRWIMLRGTPAATAPISQDRIKEMAKLFYKTKRKAVRRKKVVRKKRAK